MGLIVIQDKRRQGHNQSGFTLIEIMIAFVIILIVMLGLLNLTAQVTEVGVRNAIRDEAVRLAEEIMDQERAKPFDDIGKPPTINKRTRKIRNVSFEYEYSVSAQPNSNDANIKIITVEISWDYRGKQYTHSISSIVRRTE